MSRPIDRLVVCLFLLVVLTPGAAMLMGADDARVRGALVEIVPPRFTWTTVRNEELQHQATAWFERNLGYRGVAIHVDNSILLHGFGETKPGATTILGEDGMLFLNDDIAHFNKRTHDVMTPRQIGDFADRVASVQRRLHARGKTLVVMIIPGKSTMYPERIPAGWRRTVESPRPAEVEYANFVRAFDERRVSYVDIHAALTDGRWSTDRNLLWRKEARHWSLYAACRASGALVANIAEQRGTPAPAYPCIMVPQTEPLPRMEHDLQRTMNAWGLPDETKPVPYPIGMAPDAVTLRPKLAITIVGTSFMWLPVYDVTRSKLFRRIVYFYYNTTFIEWPANQHLPIEPLDPAWTAIVRDTDVFVLDLFEPYAETNGYGRKFLDQMSEALDREDAARAAP
jgi:hypothetical protein